MGLSRGLEWEGLSYRLIRANLLAAGSCPSLLGVGEAGHLRRAQLGSGSVVPQGKGALLSEREALGF
jgi:hypothetical protein